MPSIVSPDQPCLRGNRISPYRRSGRSIRLGAKAPAPFAEKPTVPSIGARPHSAHCHGGACGGSARPSFAGPCFPLQGSAVLSTCANTADTRPPPRTNS